MTFPFPTSKRRLGAALLLVLGAGGPLQATAQAQDSSESESYSLHAQFTSVTQRHGSFRSPYQGDNSLTPERSQKATNDITLFLGLRLWVGAAVYANPELDQGYGFSNTLGVAGFPSGEAYKVGSNRPYWRMPRLFLRQEFALGDGTEPVASGPNALAGVTSTDRLTLTIGKFGVGDIFDNNRYAHDPRADFLNWSVIESGAFDYAADAWGYTQGAAADWRVGDWSARLGVFALSDVPNSVHIDTSFSQRAVIAEAERRHDWMGGGALRLLVYRNEGRMGRYDDAVRLAAATGTLPEMASVRRRAGKAGAALNLEQQLAPQVGGFLRWSASQGAHEAFDFTEINRSLAAGVSLDGALWGQPTHSWGLAGVSNNLSGAAIAYFRAGGMGILIGDGRLPRYGSERIVETYYRVTLGPWAALSGDLQRVTNPAYNRDRGPVDIASLRLHLEY